MMSHFNGFFGKVSKNTTVKTLSGKKTLNGVDNWE